MITVTDNMLPLQYGTAVTVGNFDGVHTGHRSLIEKVCLLASERSLVPAVWTFEEHPDSFINRNTALISDGKEKELILSSLGVGAVYNADFLKFCDMEPEEFAVKVLCGDLNAKTVVCGYDFRFGAKARGDAELLRSLLAKNGVECVVMPPFTVDGITVSSTVIRKRLADGDIETASKMLGRPYGFCLPVIHGLENGRKLGFRTINQRFPSGRAFPRRGVYTVRCFIGGKEFNGVANIGIRPTVDEKKEGVLCETHLFDFDEELYGEKVRTELVKMIRPEKKFGSLTELKAQVDDDILRAKEFFAFDKKAKRPPEV